MRKKRFLAAILLSLSFCFVSGVGYGEIKPWMYTSETSYIDGSLLRAKVDYIMYNPDDFLVVRFYYDPYGNQLKDLLEKVDTEGKILIRVRDNRNVFFRKSRKVLLDQFREELEDIYQFIEMIATDMDTDIAALFYSTENIPLAYFYQGEYHLWED